MFEKFSANDCDIFFRAGCHRAACRRQESKVKKPGLLTLRILDFGFWILDFRFFGVRARPLVLCQDKNDGL
jgi:hypothetical protein